jgi:hypothetical protein
MAIRKKSKANVTAKAEPAEPEVTSAAEAPAVEIIDDTIIDDVPDDTPENGGAVTADETRLKTATQQLGAVFDSIQKRGLDALDRRQQTVQATIAAAKDKDIKAIVDRSDPGKLARLTEAVADGTTRLENIAAERSILVDSMARARQAMGVKQPRRRAVGK